MLEAFLVISTWIDIIFFLKHKSSLFSYVQAEATFLSNTWLLFCGSNSFRKRKSIPKHQASGARTLERKDVTGGSSMDVLESHCGVVWRCSAWIVYKTFPGGIYWVQSAVKPLAVLAIVLEMAERNVWQRVRKTRGHTGAKQVKKIEKNYPRDFGEHS